MVGYHHCDYDHQHHLQHNFQDHNHKQRNDISNIEKFIFARTNQILTIPTRNRFDAKWSPFSCGRTGRVYVYIFLLEYTVCPETCMDFFWKSYLGRMSRTCKRGLTELERFVQMKEAKTKKMVQLKRALMKKSSAIPSFYIYIWWFFIGQKCSQALTLTSHHRTD